MRFFGVTDPCPRRRRILVEWVRAVTVTRTTEHLPAAQPPTYRDPSGVHRAVNNPPTSTDYWKHLDRDSWR